MGHMNDSPGCATVMCGRDADGECAGCGRAFCEECIEIHHAEDAECRRLDDEDVERYWDKLRAKREGKS